MGPFKGAWVCRQHVAAMGAALADEHLINDERYIRQNVIECRRALVDDAKLNLARKEERSHHSCWQNLDEESVHTGDPSREQLIH